MGKTQDMPAKRRSVPVMIEGEAEVSVPKRPRIENPDEMSKNELRDELKARGLDSSGKKSELLLLLQADMDDDHGDEEDELAGDVGEDGNVKGLIDDTEQAQEEEEITQETTNLQENSHTEDTAITNESPTYVHIGYCNGTCENQCNPNGQPKPPYTHVFWCNGSCGEVCAGVRTTSENDTTVQDAPATPPTTAPTTATPPTTV